ncbi:hypothetical protein [Pseudomonas turukhanskensis]|uniref:Uncharacterized protein n=1 Tax=Pseudomonas turukhanskensis TaxID=1806536 RepID=A0A9W6K673_9PSED|nr:hypothetical protein [Pseudomonas turukhanskensis]GLK89632.1 hypothetical protein GCM10017655_26940 [Pseudomonas turukhanskensis]
MNQALDHWLDSWGEWLDSLLATGLGSPSQATRAHIQAWCADAALLGFAVQSEQAERLLQGATSAVQRHQLFLDLLLEQDMLVRLNAANRLLASGETVETAAIQNQSE